ncbi:hypothetical protein FJZ28_01065 [Candidatus Peregrinibacteria bacterium]|nr:hypothetical protein [Candidatus Peregrinibacteria bacterium]
MPPTLEHVLVEAKNLLNFESPNFEITFAEDVNMHEYAEFTVELLLEMEENWENVLFAHVGMVRELLRFTGAILESSTTLTTYNTCSADQRLLYLQQTVHKACYLVFKRSL